MSKPNVIFFFTDDQRFDTIRALGNKHISTPNIDALVREGTAFTNAHIMGGTSPAVCMPSRAMLHTGRTLFHIQEQGQDIPAEHTMMGECFQRAGYRTFGTGKWHNGRPAYARSFTDGAEIFFGGMWDHWNVPAYDFDPTGRYDTQQPQCRNFGTSNKLDYMGCDHIKAGKHSSELFADATIAFLKGRKSKDPFFAYVSFMAPHDPRTMPRKFLEMYDPDKIPLPENFLPDHPFDNGELAGRDEELAPHPRTPDVIRRHIAEYCAMISHADAEIGRVIEALKDTGQYEDTVIVFAGDNGLALGRHGLMGKQNVYDHSVHVPLIMAGPGVPKGETRDALCYLIDIFPTLCALADVPVPATVEGRSLAPVMHDPAHAIRDTLPLAYLGLHRSVRDDRWKLIEYVVDGTRTTQLFDLENDPFEMNNLAGDAACAQHLRRLSKELIRWHGELDDPYDEFWNKYEEDGT